MQLWLNNRCAIRVAGVIGKIILVVTFGLIKHSCRGNFRYNGPVKNLFIGQRFYHCSGLLLLFISIIKYCRTVLRANIIPLAV